MTSFEVEGCVLYGSLTWLYGDIGHKGVSGGGRAWAYYLVSEMLEGRSRVKWEVYLGCNVDTVAILSGGRNGGDVNVSIWIIMMEQM